MKIEEERQDVREVIFKMVNIESENRHRIDSDES